MCVSPEVDVLAGAAITVVAVDALRHVGHRRLLPLAMLPAIFAIHTFSSALIWWGERADIPQSVGEAASVFFIVIAFVFLPVYVPISILLLEPRGWRRDSMLLLVGAGAVAGAQFLSAVMAGRSSATACDYYINFQVTGIPLAASGLYVIATCGAMLLSGQRILFWWGVVNAVAVAALVAWTQDGLPSLWCLWAACTSVFVAWYLRNLQKERAEGGDWPWCGKPAATSVAPAPAPGTGTGHE